MTSLVLLLSMIPGDRDSDAAAALALAASSIKHSEPIAEPLVKGMFDDYGKARVAAIAQGKSLIVWVGQKPKCHVPGSLCCYQPTFPECTAPCVVVSRPEPSVGLQWLKTLAGTPTRDEIEMVLSNPVSLRSSLVEERAAPVVLRTIRSDAPARFSRSC